jgi:hypothetical protein
MTPEPEDPRNGGRSPEPAVGPDHPMAGAGQPVSEGEAGENRDREPPA